MTGLQIVRPHMEKPPPPAEIGWRTCLEIPARAESVSSTLFGLCQHLLMLGLRIEQLFSMELVLAEILNNIVEHAYRNSGEGKIFLEISVHDQAIWCRVRDRGFAMPDHALPEANRYSPEEMMVEDLPEGGFGWALIRDLASDLRYSREAGENLCSFHIGLDT